MDKTLTNSLGWPAQTRYKRRSCCRFHWKQCLRKKDKKATENPAINVALPTSLPAAPGSDLSASAYRLHIAL
jgi:hypothetical protein